MGIVIDFAKLFINFGLALQRQQRLQEIQEFLDNNYENEIDFHGLDESDLEDVFRNASNCIYGVSDFLEGTIPESEEKRIFNEYFANKLAEHLNGCYSEYEVENALEKNGYTLEEFKEKLEEHDYTLDELLNSFEGIPILDDILLELKSEHDWNKLYY